jgi:hypothetical protein
MTDETYIQSFALFRPIDDSDELRSFLTSESSLDFIAAHKIAINLHRPMVSSVFSFAMISWYFPEINDEIAPYYHG